MADLVRVGDSDFEEKVLKSEKLVGALPKAEILQRPGATSWRVMRAGHSAPRPARRR